MVIKKSGQLIKIIKQSIPLILIGIAISFSPDFPIGVIAKGRILKLRAEDILFAIFGIWWLISFLAKKKTRVKKPPLVSSILTWFLFGVSSTLINLLLGNVIPDRAFFYVLKEFEYYFLYFYVFYHILSIETVEILIKSWVIFGLLNFILIIYQLISGIHYGDYGPGLFMEKGPLPSGGYFLILFTFLLNIFLYYSHGTKLKKLTKVFMILTIIGLSLGIFSSGSRTAVLGWFISIMFTFLLYFNYHNKISVLYYFSSVSILAIAGWGILKILSKKVKALLRMETHHGIESGLQTRIYVWKNQIVASLKHPEVVFIGLGKSVYLWTEESHSQYVRNFIETGTIGSILFFMLIYNIVKRGLEGLKYKTSNLLKGLSSGLIVSTIVMLFISIFAEAFMVIRIAETYWYFVGLTMITLYLETINFHKKEEHERIEQT